MQATADNIQAMLSPDVIGGAEYKKWWEGAKRALKKNGLFYVPGKKNEALRQLEAPTRSATPRWKTCGWPTAPSRSWPRSSLVGKYWPDIKSDSTLNELASCSTPR